MELPYFLRPQTNLCLNDGEKEIARERSVYDFLLRRIGVLEVRIGSAVSKRRWGDGKPPTAELYALVYRGLGTERIKMTFPVPLYLRSIGIASVHLPTAH
jgi:hypothetical protein